MKKVILLLVIVSIILSFSSCKKEEIEQKDTRQYFHNGMIYVNQTYRMRDTCRSFDAYCIDCDDNSVIDVMIEHQGSLTTYETLNGSDTVHVVWYHSATTCRLTKSTISSQVYVMNLK